MQTEPLQREEPGTLLPVIQAPRASAAPSLLEMLLQDQQQLTAVEEFSQHHDRMASADSFPAQARYYRRLLPSAPPSVGQQYAFDVDLDRCSGCKACVVACHSLNGLDEKETWRDVGLLIGGTRTQPVMQHVTTACHHCLEPGCMEACPVDAYEKDPVTGIVKHLDDQCFGCQYCTLACPYDVPKYHSGKGIVRKCDMCADRLAVGEAPACVHSCPHEAIAIRVIDVAEVRENAEADSFLPAAPEPHLTFPTTTFRTKRVFPRNMLPADYYSVNPQHPHWPLILMLVLTQLSVGTFAVGLALESWLDEAALTVFRPLQSAVALTLGLLALGASTLHLGRPQYAFRAIIGLRHSWLSREIVAFGLFAATASAYAALVWWNLLPVALLRIAGQAVVATGTLGLFCSAMIYVFTKREFWSFSQTATKFALTALNLGVATTFLVIFLFAIAGRDQNAALLYSQAGELLAKTLLLGTAVKLLFEASLLTHLMKHRNSPLKRSARLLTGPLSGTLIVRTATGLLGGFMMPLFLLTEKQTTIDSLPSLMTVGILFLACLAGELTERYQFFAAVSAPRMPGGPRR
ncbi:MAG: DmsC/YnfH family molybdoenzyme membrane anchor subunit [Planctomycetaceae bacterium]